jgi:diguanylate cyclase (GGDEF)-like protein/PAS domain S-box-containing protein
MILNKRIKKLRLHVDEQSTFYIIGFALCYFLLGRLSIYANSYATIVAPIIFVPAALSFLMAFILNKRFWISIFVGEYLISSTLGMPFGVSLGLGVANTLSFLLSIKLIERFRINPIDISPKTFWLQNWVIFITQIVSGLLANLFIHINSPSDPINIVLSQTLSWILSNVLTIILILPIGLSVLLKKMYISSNELIALISFLGFAFFLTTWEFGNPILIIILMLALLILIAIKSKNLIDLSLVGLAYISLYHFSHHQGIWGARELTLISLATTLILISLILKFLSNLSETQKIQILIEKKLRSKLDDIKTILNEKYWLNLNTILKTLDEYIKLKDDTGEDYSEKFSLQSTYASLIASEAKISSVFNRIFVLYFLIRMLHFNIRKNYVPFRSETYTNQIMIIGFIADCLANESGELLEVRNRYINLASKLKYLNINEYPEFLIIEIVEEFYDLTERRGVTFSSAIASIKAAFMNQKNQFVDSFEKCVGDVLVARGFSEAEKQSIINQYNYRNEDNIDVEVSTIYPLSDGLYDDNHIYKFLFNSSSIGLALVDLETGRFLEVNNALLKMTGYFKEEFLDKTIWDITPRNYADQEDRQLTALIRTGKFGPNEKEYIRKDGKLLNISIEGFITTHQNKKCIWGIIHDQTNSKNIAELSEQKIGRDFLTGLANRYLWKQRISQAIALASRNKTTVSLIVIDMDKFKSINDNYGHQLGDEVLIEFSKRLNHVIKRKSDTPARLGGDEFAVLLPDTDIGDAIIIAKKILDSTNPPFILGQMKLNIHCSIGISTTKNSGYDEGILFEIADINLLKAKKNGRNNYMA